MKTRRLVGSTLIILLALQALFIILPAYAENYDWSKPRPSTDRMFNETIERASTDGEAAVAIGVTVGKYSENDPAYNADHLSLKVCVSANTRRGIDYVWNPPVHGFE
ncbi:MAG: hypothetical protein QXQ94_10655 [Candidatus Bathyarchaeia archaeon]